jgi:2-oxoglutarate ferredoxin oxidoreductase subunit alpha
MKDDVFTFIVGGKAGEGIKKAGSAASHMFVSMGRHVFEMDDYQSLIRGGHNFSAVSTSTRIIRSHYMKADLVVVLDERSHDIHRDHIASNGILVFNSDKMDENGMGDNEIGLPFTSKSKKYPPPDLRLGLGAVAVLASALGLDSPELEKLVRKEYPRDVENNISFAKDIYKVSGSEIFGRFELESGKEQNSILSGNQALALGAASAGLSTYFAYPMTPSSSLLHYLAAHAKELGVAVVHPENEISVVNMAIGAAFAGARSMVGTSGGGFALMQEGLSLAGMSETPLLVVLSSRPGPSTGVPTYTEQGDLGFALNYGQGEFPRIVASPGSIGEAFFLAAEMLDIVWRFQTPGILLTEKHLSESSMSVKLDLDALGRYGAVMQENGEYNRYIDTEDGISPLRFPPSEEPIKANSYEHDEAGLTTEGPEAIARMHDKRKRKGDAVEKFLRGIKTVNVFGEGEPAIFTYGSTTMSVMEALRFGGLDAKVVQPVYLRPFPVWALKDYKGEKGVVVEMSSTGQFATLLREKIGIMPKRVIKKYDGRPFEPVALAESIREAI